MKLTVKLLMLIVFCKIPVFGEQEMTGYYATRTKGVVAQALELNSRHVLCGRIKIKKGCLNEVRDWFATLNNNKEELLKAFALEGVWIESVFLEHTPEGDFLVYYMRQDDIEKAFENLAKFGLPTRLFHVECWKKYCEECIILEPIFDLKR